MMGRQTGDQSQLFYLFNLERRIPTGHLLRRINPVVARILVELREKLVSFYSDIGRPSIDPELMIRMLIVGYCYGIRSERQLCEEVELHLAYRWFCRLDLDDQVPDHSTFSVNRHGRFRDSDILRQVFEAVVRACMDAGLVKGEGFAVDASVIEANASRYHGKAPDEIDWSVPERQSRAAAEFLAGLDDEDPDANRKPPKLVSPSDPCAAWTAKANKRVQFGYGLNYLIDIAHAIIVDVEPTPARTYDEVASTKTMLDRTEQRFGLKPKRLAADTAYGTSVSWTGWLATELYRTSRSATPASATMARYRAATFAGTGGEDTLTNVQSIIASIAHEVRQPLTAIVANGGAALRFLERAPVDSDEVRAALNRMIADCHRTSALFDSIRALFAPGDRQIQPVNLNEINLEVLQSLRGELESNGVTIRSQLMAEVPLVDGHRTQLQEVVTNLIHNAAEAMVATTDRARVLKVRTESCRQDAIRVTVEDLGRGIAHKQLNHIFDAFVSTKATGMGLGLGICKMIIERHGGDISAFSDGKSGTTMQFVVPISGRKHSTSKLTHAKKS